jgi:hypothetical protein
MILATTNKHDLCIRIVILLTCYLPNNFKAFSQDTYLKLGAGYQVSSNPSFAQNTVSNTNSSYTTNTYTTENIGFGKGFNFDAVIGHFFTPNIGTELGFKYLLGTKNEYTNESTNLNANNNFSKSTNEFKSRMLFINPSLVLIIPMDKWSPYARFGLVFGLGNIITETNTKLINGNNSSQSYSKEKTSGGVALGANGTFGLERSINTQLNVFAEVSVNSINYKPRKTEITEYTLNGNDIINTLSTRDRIIEYENEYTEVNSSNPVNPNEPDKFGRINMPLSNICFQVGIRFSLGR